MLKLRIYAHFGDFFKVLARQNQEHCPNHVVIDGESHLLEFATQFRCFLVNKAFLKRQLRIVKICDLICQFEVEVKSSSQEPSQSINLQSIFCPFRTTFAARFSNTSRAEKFFGD